MYAVVSTLLLSQLAILIMAMLNVPIYTPAIAQIAQIPGVLLRILALRLKPG